MRDILIQVTLTRRFRARWSHPILDECFSNLLEDRPDLRPAALERTRAMMIDAVPDCIVAGFESVIPTLEMPDPNDRHVLAAAIVGRADVIVTFNLKDFPARVLSQYDLDAQHPDVFLEHLLDLDSVQVATEIERCRRRCQNPAYTFDDYCSVLEGHGLTRTVERLCTLKAWALPC